MRTLPEHDLVDELRLMVFPVVPGSGERLFGPAVDRTAVRLLEVGTGGDCLARLTYRTAREGEPGDA
ncbi:dihydrofolate reductase family protein [Blastococcus sp. VKM Ac-2987]|uniref:dihydrofolate reductase family protein n=1 Tax=Blastococcus sp. VKM Ac-2987 TaxID=3004141 RepID=UPI0022AB8DE2|nr:dihydrofolate reductase family protein [Blastococcus sp. VKM Ac-2987]MCZ2860309.1 dihydrofolate reductase family protein [Blastococcus sp. VKM Ac-2987]